MWWREVYSLYMCLIYHAGGNILCIRSTYSSTYRDINHLAAIFSYSILFQILQWDDNRWTTCLDIYDSSLYKKGGRTNAWATTHRATRRSLSFSDQSSFIIHFFRLCKGSKSSSLYVVNFSYIVKCKYIYNSGGRSQINKPLKSCMILLLQEQCMNDNQTRKQT